MTKKTNGPAVLFYCSDFLGGTHYMTLQEVGAYARLLFTQFEDGPLTEEMIFRICGESTWKSIRKKFQKLNDGTFINERMELERTKREKFVQSRRSNLQGEGAHKGSHMGNGNGNRDINENTVTNLKDQKTADFIAWVDKENDDILDKGQREDFIKYWIETKGKKGTQLRWEKEPTFQVKPRMQRWARNNFDDKGGNSSRVPEMPDEHWYNNQRDTKLLSEANKLWNQKGYRGVSKGTYTSWVPASAAPQKHPDNKRSGETQSISDLMPNQQKPS